LGAWGSGAEALWRLGAFSLKEASAVMAIA